MINGGEVFAPFRSKQKEIGLKYEGGSIGASVAAFSTDQPQYFVQNGVFGANGEQRNQGLEFSVFGEATRGLRVLGGLTLLDAEQRRTVGGATDGKDVIGVPHTQFNMGVEWDVPGVRGLALNGRWIYTSKQFADAANTQELPAWNRLDIGARYLVDIGSGRVLTLRARIDNVFNKSYWASAGGLPGLQLSGARRAAHAGRERHCRLLIAPRARAAGYFSSASSASMNIAGTSKPVCW